jgi:hypothetical protein
MLGKSLIAVGIVGSALVATGSAHAGIDACGNVRLEDANDCEIVLSGQCSASCDELGVYKKACATKLVTVCGDQCTLSADATCEDECTVQCKQDCDNGVNVICQHNCFAECTTTREADCASSADPEQCAATWDANCDSECDLQCVTVDGGCYEHCIECCGGSCTASANMDCQQVCQEQQFEECELEFRADCSASCSGDGALFCDGEYVLSGSQLPACVEALIAEGIGSLEAEGEITLGPDGLDANGTAGFCSMGHRASLGAALPLGLGAAVLGLVARRRRRAR